MTHSRPGIPPDVRSACQEDLGDPITGRPEVWIVVPAYNEAPRIRAALSQLIQASVGNIVVIDDGSKDNTADIVSGLPVWLLRHPFNCGQGAALQTGIEFALQRNADILVTFDSDGQHSADELHRVIDPIRSGRCDVTLGTRFSGSTSHIPIFRKLLLKAAVVFTRLTTGLEITDSHNGLRALSRKAAESIKIRQPRMAHASEILDQIAIHQLRYEEVPVTISYTTETLAKGQSSWDALRIGGQLILDRFVK